MPRVRFFPDYGAESPLWDATGSLVSLDALPLRTETKADLRAWCARWEPLAWQQMDAEAFADGMSDRVADPVPRETWSELDDEARRLRTRVQQELGPDWEVVYEAF